MLWETLSAELRGFVLFRLFVLFLPSKLFVSHFIMATRCGGDGGEIETLLQKSTGHHSVISQKLQTGRISSCQILKKNKI